MAEERRPASATQPPGQPRTSAIQRTAAAEQGEAVAPPLPDPAAADQAPAGDAEIVAEEDKEEEEEEPVINLPLAVAFFVGGLGFLLIFLVSLLSGSHVLMALFWGAAGFFGLAMLGYVMDMLLNLAGAAKTQVEATAEPELVLGIGVGEGGETPNGGLGASVDVTIAEEAALAQQAPEPQGPAAQ